MATSTKRSVNVGLFVVIGIIIFIVGILTIGSMKKVFSSTITVKTIFDDVNGLKLEKVKINKAASRPLIILNNVKDPVLDDPSLTR